MHYFEERWFFNFKEAVAIGLTLFVAKETFDWLCCTEKVLMDRGIKKLETLMKKDEE